MERSGELLKITPGEHSHRLEEGTQSDCTVSSDVTSEYLPSGKLLGRGGNGNALPVGWGESEESVGGEDPF